MKIMIFGAGGQARVIYECIRLNKNIEITSFIHNEPVEENKKLVGVPIIGPHSVVPELMNEGVFGFIVGVGDNKIREDHFKKFKKMDLVPINAIHPTANLAHKIEIGAGIVIGMGATINTHAHIGDNCIINTRAVIEHDNYIEENVHIAPGTLLAGGVKIKSGAFIGIGSVIIEYLTIGKNAIIGAGSVVLEDIPDNAVAVGSPARIVKYNKK